MNKLYHLAIDDTDSNTSMCTTYLGTIILELLKDNNAEFIDFPWLIRLNPNIPYKTRGNGSVKISFYCNSEMIDDLWKKIVNLVRQYSDIEAENTSPGVVLLQGEIPAFFNKLYIKALYELIELEDVKSNLEVYKNKLKLFSLKEGRGLIGASSAIGAILSDYTYEFIAYRYEKNCKTKRVIDKQSVLKADKATPLTFNNIDYDHGNDVMILPHGNDPIFCGIRGETTEQVIEMWKKLNIEEPIEKVMIFRTNQHTKVHFPKLFNGDELGPYKSVKTIGKIITNPHDIEGGHVIFSVEIGNKIVDCAAYEPTKKFRNIIRELIIGDEIIIFGGIRKPESARNLTINVEEIQIVKLKEIFDQITPKCPSCKLTLKSAGTKAGFKCKKCNYKTKTKNYMIIPKTRKLKTGIRYVTPVCAQRHLTKPVTRDRNNQLLLTEKQTFKEMMDSFLIKRNSLLKKN